MLHQKARGAYTKKTNQDPLYDAWGHHIFKGIYLTNSPILIQYYPLANKKVFECYSFTRKDCSNMAQNMFSLIKNKQ